MSNTIFLSVSALIYSLIIMIIFRLKDKIAKIENIIYRYLLIATVFSCVSELLIPFFDFNSVLGKLVQKSFLMFVIIWFCLFVIYTFVIAKYDHNDKNKINKYEKYLTYFIIFNAIICSLIYILPIYFYDVPPAKYTYGPAVNVVFATVGVYMTFLGFILLKNIKYIKEKKYLPIILTVALFTVAVIIQKINPSLLLINSVIGIVTAIMYFTLENPDLKMLNDYREAKEYAEDLNIEKQMFIYNISQDMKQPLLKISRFCEKLLYSEDIEEYKNGIRNIKSECNSMLQGINAVFDIDVKDIRDLSTDNTKYNIVNFLKLVGTNMRNRIKESGKKIEFISSISETLPKDVIGDSARLKEVLKIVFDNALKHTKEGYIEFHVSEVHKNNICRLMITIEDSGVGIDAEKLDDIFDRDRIVDKKDSDKIAESGENLAFAKKIINILGGNLIVSSQLGIGTKVSIVLDQELVDEKEKDIDKYEKEYIKDKKILVLGTTDEEQPVLMRSIAEFGGVMEIVDSINDVIDKLKKHNRYYTIIIDGDNLHRTASELLSKLKEMKGFNTPVIVLTKDKGMKSLKNLAILGFASSILRPFKEEDVIKALEKVEK